MVAGEHTEGARFQEKTSLKSIDPQPMRRAGLQNHSYGLDSAGGYLCRLVNRYFASDHQSYSVKLL